MGFSVEAEQQIEALLAWVKQQPGQAQAAALQPLSGDAGFRRYCRVISGDSHAPPVMAVYAPPATENSAQYLMVSRLLSDGGVRVPTVLATDLERGFLLVEDCGDQLLLPALNSTNVNRLYGQATDMLLTLQAVAVPEGALPHYDAQRLWDEMALFPTWFIQGLLDLPLGRHEQTLLHDCFDGLVASALEQPQVLVHRDFHARNLMLHPRSQPPGELVTIDFQDAVIGPVTYDLVSLLRDCYIQWAPEQVSKWALAYRKSLINKNCCVGVSEEQFLRWFDLMGLQRHIKVLGIFARLWLRDGKAGYLHDLPLVLHYTLEVASQYPQAAELVEWLQARVLPACQRQPWWKALP
ncbi:MAG: phosphotransferase [Pseudomonadales bacterium]|nr:phosphotransferase [Pseudomonadales bacterium]